VLPFLRIGVSSTSKQRRRYSRAPQLNCATVRNVNLEARWNLLAAHASLRRRPVEWRKSVTKAVLKPILVMISAAALLWCVAMAVHLAHAEALTGIG
jgi:hypothetical protein